MTPAHFFLSLVCIFFWGASFPLSKAVLNHIPPFFFMGVRFLLTALIVVPFIKFPKKDAKNLLIFSFIMGIMMTSLFHFGLDRVSASTSLLLIQIQVPFASLMAALFFSEKLEMQRAFGIALAFAGIVLIIGNPDLDGSFLGVVLVVLAAMSFSAGSLYAKKLSHISGLTLFGWMNAFSFLPFLIFAFIFESPDTQMLMRMAQPDLLWIVASIVVGSVFCYTIWYFLLQTYPINQVIPLSMLEPVFGILISVFFLGETLSSGMLFGGILTMVGVATVILRRRPFQRVYKP